MKDARLSFPLTEVMRTVRLTPLLPEVLRLSLPKPRLRQGSRLATLSLSPKSNPKSMFSLLRSVTGSSSNFPNSSSSKKSVLDFTDDLRSHFSVYQPKTQRSSARGYRSELCRATYSEEFHSLLSSAFSSLNFLWLPPISPYPLSLAQTKLPIPKHFPRSGVDFVLHIFNLSWSLHSFPSIWKTSSIIPIHKMRKPLDSSAFSRPISLTPAYQRFLKASFYLVYCSFWSIIPFSLPARPVSALDGLHLIQFCSFLCPFRMGLTNPGRALGRSSLYEFSKAFDSVWHRALFHKLISAGLSSCFARWIQSFLSDRRACVIYQNHKSRSLRVRRGVPQGSILGAVLFSLFINDLPASLSYSVSCSLFADDLAIWSSTPSVPTSVEATQGALFRLERWSEQWCLRLNPSNCECSSFFSVDPHQANLQPSLLIQLLPRFQPYSNFSWGHIRPHSFLF